MISDNDNVRVEITNRKYKDTVFTTLFSTQENLFDGEKFSFKQEGGSESNV